MAEKKHSQIPHERDQGQWKDRPPYQIRSSEEFGPIKWTGSCHCGQITYKLNRAKPLVAKFCHCRGCQVMHGAPFQWAAIFHKFDITFNRGVEGLTFYSSTSHSREYELPTKVACSFCRTPIMDEGRNVCLIFPELIQMEKSDWGFDTWKRAFEASCHICYSRRVVDIRDGKPKWSGIDQNSDLLDDAGNVQNVYMRSLMYDTV